MVILHFKEGQAVNAGEALVTLDQDEYKAQLAGSAAQVGLEESSYQRLQDLRRKNLTSQQNLDETKARLDAAPREGCGEDVGHEEPEGDAPRPGAREGVREECPGVDGAPARHRGAGIIVGAGSPFH